MTTVASPVSVRDQALAVIAAQLGSEPALQMLLGEIGGSVFVDLLCRLEQRFDIGLDVDELLPNGTVAVLAELVALRAAAALRADGGARLYHWDDERLRRGMPYFAGRPTVLPFRSASAPPGESRCPLAERGPTCAPPPWPDLLAAPRTPCAPVAVPSEEAWALALDVYAREERWRTRTLVAACILAPFAIGAGGVWLHALRLV